MSPDLCVGFFLRSFFVTLLYLVQVVGLPAAPVPVMLAAAPRSLDPLIPSLSRFPPESLLTG